MKNFLFSTILSAILFSYFSCTAKEDLTEVGETTRLTYKIMIVPDIQNYNDNSSRFKYLDSIANYYLTNLSNYVACFQVGDITNNNQLWQYQNANDHFFSKFPEGEKPYFCLGNHDYGNNGKSDRRFSNIPSFMWAQFDVKKDESEFENYVRFLKIGETRYAVMDLEFAPRDETLIWANEIVNNNPTTPFIILTHVFTNKYGQIHDVTDSNVYYPGSQKSYVMGGDYINDSMEIFNKLIKNNRNVKMVICGHTFIPDYIKVATMENAFGDDVFVITVNYQHYTNGGDGYVGILEFGEDGYRIRSFCTVNKEYGPVNIVFGQQK